MNPVRRLRAALTGPGTVTFCDSCGQVCDARCRATAARDHALTTALLLRR